MLSSIQPLSAALGAAPVLFDTTCPSLKMKSDGMPRTPMDAAVLGLLSTSTLATLIASPYSVASSSKAGPICLQGPHHSAQKSTTTGTLEFFTSASNVSSVTATVDMSLLLAACAHHWGQGQNLCTGSGGVKMACPDEGLCCQVFGQRHIGARSGPKQSCLD